MDQKAETHSARDQPGRAEFSSLTLLAKAAAVDVMPYKALTLSPPLSLMAAA